MLRAMLAMRKSVTSRFHGQATALLMKQDATAVPLSICAVNPTLSPAHKLLAGPVLSGSTRGGSNGFAASCSYYC